MNENQRQDALRHAQESARKFGLHPAFAEKIMLSILAARGHLSPSDDPFFQSFLAARGHLPTSDDPFNTPLFPPDHNPFLDMGWDDEPGSYQEARRQSRSDNPFAAPGVMSATTVTAVRANSKTGEVKIIKFGHKLARESLDQLGHPELARTIRDFHAASQSLDSAQKEHAELAVQIKELRQFASCEPELIQYAIRSEFPEGTAGQIVEITAKVEVGGYNLYVGGTLSKVNVPEDFGKRMWDREENLDNTKQRIVKNVDRQGELERQIAGHTEYCWTKHTIWQPGKDGI